MNRNGRRIKKLKNVVIYLCNNNIFNILFFTVELLVIFLSFLYDFNNIAYFLLCVIVEAGIIISTIRKNDKVKDNKLIYVILSKKFPILYPLILLCLYFAFYICKCMDYFINFNFINFMLIYVGVLCILLWLQIIFVEKINEFFKEKLR